MARELRIGDRVRTPLGVEFVVSLTADTVCTSIMGVPAWWDPGDITPLPADIPRERVEALLGELDAELRGCVSPEDAHESLEHFVARLRELLEATDGE